MLEVVAKARVVFRLLTIYYAIVELFILCCYNVLQNLVLVQLSKPWMQLI